MKTRTLQWLITLKKGWNEDQDIINNWSEVQPRGSFLSRGAQRAFPLFVAEKFSVGHASLLSTTNGSNGFQTRTGIPWSLNLSAPLMKTSFTLPSSQGSCILKRTFAFCYSGCCLFWEVPPPTVRNHPLDLLHEGIKSQLIICPYATTGLQIALSFP